MTIAPSDEPKRRLGPSGPLTDLPDWKRQAHRLTQDECKAIQAGWIRHRLDLVLAKANQITEKINNLKGATQ